MCFPYGAKSSTLSVKQALFWGGRGARVCTGSAVCGAVTPPVISLTRLRQRDKNRLCTLPGGSTDNHIKGPPGTYCYTCVTWKEFVSFKSLVLFAFTFTFQGVYLVVALRVCWDGEAGMAESLTVVRLPLLPSSRVSGRGRESELL